MTKKIHLLRDGGDWLGDYNYLAFPMYGIKPAGYTSTPDIDQESGILAFDNKKKEAAAACGQMPHGWRHGTNIIPGVFIRGTVATDPLGTQACLWQLEYKWYNQLTAVPPSFSIITTLCVLPAHSGGQPINTKFFFDALPGIDRTHNSILQWRITRLANDALDTYNDDCFLLHFNIKYKQYKFGADI